ncbi:hypothetical protein CYLTODRAFT_440482 [Cylindrobasidium torrendii FP15055 ss-10]|uniref:Uncharacterized protein n=1 Tax=Cylindrobasidium torrendii FP15055 ss-10 TaxID=1314674 RepID=A0A0D7BQX2_9AGAR|nr:hypothetical protein CYLTODRAFT_440482 [Cylindrobasidium torrendii FP15055 ss-10]
MTYIVGVTFSVNKVADMARARGYPVTKTFLNVSNLIRIISATFKNNQYPYALAFAEEGPHLIVVISLDGGMSYWDSKDAEKSMKGCAIPEEWKVENPACEWMTWLDDTPRVFQLYSWEG